MADMDATDTASGLRARVEVDQPAGWLQIGRPRWFDWTRITLPIPRLPGHLSGLRILHLSDLHLRPAWAPGYDHLLGRISAAPPDLICFTGDFVEDKRDHRPALPALHRLFSGMTSRLGTFAIIGNHDGDLLGPHLARSNIHHITGSRHELDGLELIGFPGVARSDLEPAFLNTLPDPRREQIRIALCHYPDLFDTIRTCRPDLYLCGHSHGGQVCLPGGIPLITHDRSPRRYVRGVHRRHDCWYIANRGFGAGSLPLRLFCPPEVIEITLR